MTSTLTASGNAETAPGARVPTWTLLRASLVAALAAAAATEALTALVRAAGVELAAGTPGGSASSAVPLTFGTCTLSVAFCMVLGTALAALLNRRAQRPARTWVRTTLALTLLSLASPLLAAGTSTATKATLVTAHLVAAAIVIPLVARTLARTH